MNYIRSRTAGVVLFLILFIAATTVFSAQMTPAECNRRCMERINNKEDCQKICYDSQR